MNIRLSIKRPRFWVIALLILFVVVVGLIFKALLTNPMTHSQNANQFSESTFGLSEAKSSQVVSLKNGATYNLTAGIVKKNINGKEIKMLAYNGSIPGPTLKIPQGATITIHFTNNTDVATTLHSHGVRGENKFDGVPDVTQKEIPVGGAFTYILKFPDAGVFWYHAHVREDYTQELGLYGNYLVTPSEPNYYSPVNKETTLTVSDLLLSNGSVVPFSKNTVDHAMMGRFGNTFLVNGNTNYTLTANKGDIIRIFITNTANVRPFNITIPGAKIKLVGGDNGKYEQEQFVDSVLLSPSERAIIEAYFPSAGNYNLVNKTPQKSYQLGTIRVQDHLSATSYVDAFNTLRENQDVISLIDPYRQYFDKAPDKTLTLTLEMKQGQQNGMQGIDNGMMQNQMMGDNSGMNMESESDKIEWDDTMEQMNEASTSDMLTWKLVDADTKKENMNINWQFKKGDVVKIKIVNAPNAMHPMQHPIHIHGQRFLVLSTNGVQNIDLVWKDTVLIPKGDTVELLVPMLNPGDWVIHCHIPEHMEAGMMMKYQVI